jgi:hypothetical protein
MQRRGRIEKVLPILPVGSAMDLDQQPPPQAGDPDRRRQMIDGRGRQDGEPERLEANRFFQSQSRQGAIELNRLQKTEPVAGQRC